MSEIIGHKEALEFFDKVIANDNLSHAYCFIGPEQVGKRTVAEEIAAKLLKTSRENLFRQPDFILVGQSLNEKTGKTRKDITVEQMRELRSSLVQHAFVGGYKVALIDDAEKMNLEAANALLKRLEEPAPRTILFLIVTDEEKLPETVLSRCQRIYFHSVKKEELENYLIKLGINRPELVNSAQGLPGRLIDWLEDEDRFIKYKTETDRFLGMIGQPFFSKLKSVEELFGEKGGDTIMTRENLDSVLGLWQLLIRDICLTAAGLASEAVNQVKISTGSQNKTWVELEKQIITARGLLNQNIHPRLVLENVLLNLP
ncbi:MAG: AAA family ATPase [Candidatus Magasanikbacteria bacterium]|nr:AAA family ATPase [Candidatus Magasanikbacteria bacterium]